MQSIRSNHFSSIFRCLQLKKAIDRGQDSEISGNPLSKQRFHSDSTGTKIIGKSHTKKTTFDVFTPYLFWDQIWIRLRIRGRLVKEFFKKNKNWRSYRGEKFSALWIVTAIGVWTSEFELEQNYIYYIQFCKQFYTTRPSPCAIYV